MHLDYFNQLFNNEHYEDIFKDFDFSLFDDKSFKEDAVREEIVFPILKQLGYTASGVNKIIRSKALKHPFYFFGTKKYNINIIPDYTFQTDDGTLWILDAKRPTEDIISGDNIFQVYSYAMHPEIQSRIYYLCNGKEFAVFEVNKYEPVLFFNVKDLEANWTSLVKLLSPEFIKKPFLKNFHADFGLHLLKLGGHKFATTPITLNLKHLNFISKIEDGLYAINALFKVGEISCMATFDFNELKYRNLIDILSPEAREQVTSSLKRQPYRFMTFKKNSYSFGITILIGSDVISNENESYLPFITLGFSKYDPKANEVEIEF
jgi:hypothetical protein